MYIYFLNSLAIDCPESMAYQDCGPLCPQTCEGRDEVCAGGCAAGCFCPSGQYLRDGKCVDESFCTGNAQGDVLSFNLYTVESIQ